MPDANPKPETTVVPLTEPHRFEVSGNLLGGMAVPATGAQQLEVWHMVMNRGAVSPVHRHEGEEIFVVLSGHGEVHAEGKTYEFKGPCTVICPANVMHQVVNVGGGKLELYAIIPLGSKIFLEDGTELKLPWRQ